VSISFHRYKATSTPRRRAESLFVDPNARFVATHAKYSGLLHVVLCITYNTNWQAHVVLSKPVKRHDAEHHFLIVGEHVAATLQ
jgi:hypothetical protein